MTCFHPRAISKRANRAVSGGKRGQADMSNIKTRPQIDLTLTPVQEEF